jgi:hypothetical protein
MREVELGPVTDQVEVVAPDNYTGVTGLAPGGFGSTLWGNGVVSAATVAVTELAQGEYLVSFTPTAAGHWVLVLTVASVPRRIRREYQVVEVGTNRQARKLDLEATVGPGGAATGSLLDRLANRDVTKTYSQARDSLQALRDRVG